MEKQVKHTPFPWHVYENGGKLPGVYEKHGGWEYGPEASDWVWGPKGPGYGVVADCSPHNPCTTQSRANAQLIVSIPDLIEALEACIAELPGLAIEGYELHCEAKEKAIKALVKARGFA